MENIRCSVEYWGFIMMEGRSEGRGGGERRTVEEGEGTVVPLVVRDSTKYSTAAIYARSCYPN